MRVTITAPYDSRTHKFTEAAIGKTVDLTPELAVELLQAKCARCDDEDVRITAPEDAAKVTENATAPEPSETAAELDKLTKPELVAKLAAAGVQVSESKTKAELRDLLLQQA